METGVTTRHKGRAPASGERLRGAQLLQREEDGEVAFTSIPWFTDLDAVRSFAGEDYELAVVEEAAQAALSRWDERVSHHEVVVHVQ